MKKNSKINCFTPKTTKKPSVGDIIFGEEEFIVGRKKTDSEIIEVGLTEEQCMIKETKHEEIISKGFLFQVPYTSETNVALIDETRKNSSWVVVEVSHKEKLKLIHSTLPESYMVRAKRLIEGKITEDSETIEFYTCGAKTMFENIISKKFEVIGTMKF